MRDLLVCQRVPKAALTLRSRNKVLEHLHEVEKRQSTPLQPPGTVLRLVIGS